MALWEKFKYFQCKDNDKEPILRALSHGQKSMLNLYYFSITQVHIQWAYHDATEYRLGVIG